MIFGAKTGSARKTVAQVGQGGGDPVRDEPMAGAAALL